MNVSVRGIGSERNQYESDFAAERKAAETLDFSQVSRRQSCPQHCPHRDGPSLGDALGKPMTIREVAGLLGCSAWTVRQRHIPSGLPYFRIGSMGKLIFYRSQVVRWVLEHQRKGGIRP